MFGINSSQSIAKKLNTLKENSTSYNSKIKLELLDLKMQLEEANILNFINKTGIGFYDLFDTTDNIDIPNTTATVDTVNKKVTFIGSKVLKMLPQSFDSFSNINLNLYTEPKYATSKNEVNNSVTVIAEVADKILNIGDDLFINNTLNRIVNRENSMSTIDKTIKSLQSYNAIIDKTTPVNAAIVSGDTSFNNGDKIVMDTNGNIYVVYFYNSQVYCRKSSDDGTTWTDLGFPLISGYAQFSPSIAIDSLNNLHVVWQGLDSSNTTYTQIKYSKFNGTTWSSWINIQTISGYSQYYPSIAIDSLNNLHVVWHGYDSSNANIQIKYSKFNGTTWSSWINIQTVSGYSQIYPSIAIDSLNNLHVVWQGWDVSNATYQIKYSKFNGTTWSSWINIQPISGYNQYSPSIAIDSLNNIHVVWYGIDSSNTYQQIKYSKFNGTTWSSWINIQLISSYHQYVPSITIDSLDNLHVVWHGYDISNTSYNQIKYSKFNGTTWSSWINYTTGTANHQYNPSTCKNYKNFTEPIIIWQAQQTLSIKFRGKYTVTKTTNIYSSVANVSGNPSLNNGDKIVMDTNGNIYAVYFYDTQVYCKKSSDDGTTWADLGFPIISGYNQYRPSIAIDSLNNLHVIWYGTDVSNPLYYQIKYSKFNGTTWSSWINIQLISSYGQYYPSIAIDSLNNIHVVWYGVDSSNPSYTQIKYSKFNGTTWSSWINIQSISSYNQYSPSIAIDSLDNLHVVWHGHDSSNATYLQIKYSKFNGTTWSSWINIQTITGYSQSSPSLDIDSLNNIHVIWYGNDASYVNPQIKYSKFNGTTWSSWINIQTISGYDQYYPSIAIDSLDNLHVVWHGTDSSNISYYQIKYSKFNGTTWSSWVNYTTGTTNYQYYPSVCRNYKNFTEPVIIWQDVQTSTVQFRGKFEAAIGYVITLTNPVTLISSQKVPIADFKAKQDETQLILKSIDTDKFIFSLANIDTVVDITIECVDNILNDIAYSVS